MHDGSLREGVTGHILPDASLHGTHPGSRDTEHVLCLIQEPRGDAQMPVVAPRRPFSAGAPDPGPAQPPLPFSRQTSGPQFHSLRCDQERNQATQHTLVTATGDQGAKAWTILPRPMWLSVS